MSRQTKKPKPQTTDVSQRELARRLSINHSAVKRGIERGRLAASVTYVGGKPVIRDLEVAVTEWNAGRRPRADDDDEDDNLTDARGDSIPDYATSRAKREFHLAEIAEAEARKVTGGKWLPSTAFDELEERYAKFFGYVVTFLRAKLPLAIMQRADVNTIAKQIAETFSSGAYKQTADQLGRPAVADSAVQGIAYRLTLHEAQLAVDDVCTELSQIEPGKEPVL